MFKVKPKREFLPIKSHETVVTRAVIEALEKRQQKDLILTLLDRHRQGDWGDLDEESWAECDEDLQTGDACLISEFVIDPDLTLLVLTEWDRSVTTVLLPLER